MYLPRSTAMPRGSRKHPGADDLCPIVRTACSAAALVWATPVGALDAAALVAVVPEGASALLCRSEKMERRSLSESQQ
eukprot:7279314-Prymnesium_polylepis.3